MARTGTAQRVTPAKPSTAATKRSPVKAPAPKAVPAKAATGKAATAKVATANAVPAKAVPTKPVPIKAVPDMSARGVAVPVRAARAQTVPVDAARATPASAAGARALRAKTTPVTAAPDQAQSSAVLVGVGRGSAPRTDRPRGRAATSRAAARTVPARVLHARTTPAAAPATRHADPAERVSDLTAVASMPPPGNRGAEAYAPLDVVATVRPSRRRSRSPRPVVPVALGSLTQPGARNGDSCTVCGSARVTGLALMLTDGTPVRFTSCHACEHRTWIGPEGELDRATVLERTRKLR